MDSLHRILVGAIGGFSAILVKFLTQDESFVAHWSNIHDPRMNDIILGYAIMGPILIFIGAVVAAFSDEANKLKLLAMAVAGPGLITTWAGGVAPPSVNRTIIPEIGPAGWNLPFSPVGTAFAAEANVSVAQLSAVQKGVAAFFGDGKGAQHYWVIVGASTDLATAEALSQSINQQNPNMNAFVGKRVPGNDNYPVIVGDYVSLEDATRLEAVASQLRGVTKPYLSPFPDRRP